MKLKKTSPSQTIEPNLMRLICQLLICFTMAFLLSSCSYSQHNGYQSTVYVGNITASQLLDDYKVFKGEYVRYKVTQEQISQLNSAQADVEIDVYFGVWCHDSQREVPRFLKLVENYQNIKVNLIALDYNKQDPLGKAKVADIKFTPTFVIKRHNKELGRIVERPQFDLATDIKKISVQ